MKSASHHSATSGTVATASRRVSVSSWASYSAGDRMVQLCGKCNAQKAALRRPKTFEQVLVVSVAIKCGHASLAVAVDTSEQSEILSSQVVLKQPASNSNQA